MTIACLGWGSLIWQPGDLGVKPEDWRSDGPRLPVEFARHSSGNRLTLVLAERGPTCPVLWAELPVGTLAEAIELLRVREGKTRRHWIGRWPGGGPAAMHDQVIGEWAKAKGLEGVVWTALPAKWDGVEGRAPSLGDALAYLDSLGSEGAQAAVEYILKAPAQIETPYRSALEEIARRLA